MTNRTASATFLGSQILRVISFVKEKRIQDPNEVPLGHLEEWFLKMLRGKFNIHL